MCLFLGVVCVEVILVRDAGMKREFGYVGVPGIDHQVAFVSICMFCIYVGFCLSDRSVSLTPDVYLGIFTRPFLYLGHCVLIPS